MHRQTQNNFKKSKMELPLNDSLLCRNISLTKKLRHQLDFRQLKNSSSLRSLAYRSPNTRKANFFSLRSKKSRVLQNFFSSEFCGLPQNSRKKFLASSPAGSPCLVSYMSFLCPSRPCLCANHI